MDEDFDDEIDSYFSVIKDDEEWEEYDEKKDKVYYGKKFKYTRYKFACMGMGDESFHTMIYTPKKYGSHNRILSKIIKLNCKKFEKFINSFGFFVLSSSGSNGNGDVTLTFRTYNNEQLTQIIISKFMRNRILSTYVQLEIERSEMDYPTNW